MSKYSDIREVIEGILDESKKKMMTIFLMII